MTRRRGRLLEIVVLLVIVAAAAGARVGYLLTYADRAATAGPFQVQGGWNEVLLQPEGAAEPRPVSELDVLVGNVRDHRWFGSPAPFSDREEQTAHVAPLYPYLLAEIGRLAPYLPSAADSSAEQPAEVGPTSERLLRWFRCGLGALTAGLYFLFARRAFRSWLVAILAGAFCALHPFWIVNTAEMNDGVLASFLLAASIYLGARAGNHGEPLTSFVFGLCLAGLSLTRAACLPFALAAMLWYLWRCRSLAPGWLAGTLALLGLVMGLTPWSVRNFQAFGDGVPIVTSTWYHLWMGNNPQATGGPMDEESLLAALAEARQEDASELRPKLAQLPQLERYQSLARPVLNEATTDGPALATRRMWAGLYFFFGEDWFTHRHLYRNAPVPFEQADLAWRSYYPALLVGSLFGMLLLGVLGWRWTFGWRREAMPSSLAVFWIPLPYILGHAEALSGPRLPLDGVLLTYAAFALVCLLGLGRKLLVGAPAPI